MSSELLLLTNDSDREAVLPALALLPHRVRSAPADPGSVLGGGSPDVILVDARTDLAGARDLCRLLSAGDTPVGGTPMAWDLPWCTGSPTTSANQLCDEYCTISVNALRPWAWIFAGTVVPAAKPPWAPTK